MIADGARRLEHAQLDRAVRTHDQRGRLALRVAAHRELRHEDRVRRAAFLQPRAHKQAGQQFAARIREDGADRDGIRRRIHRHVGDFQRALFRIDLAVFVDELHARFAGLVRLEPPAREIALQAQEFAAGLRHIHVNAVELLHGREQGRRARLHVSALGHLRNADAPRDRRSDFCVVEIDPRRLHRGLPGKHIRIVRALVGERVVVVLLADRLGRQQLLVALLLQPRRRRIRLRAGECAERAVERRLIRRRIDFIKHLPLLHIAAFREEPLQDDAVHARPHLRHAKRRDAPGQILRERHRRRRNGEHADFHRPPGTSRASRRPGLFLPTARDERGRDDREAPGADDVEQGPARGRGLR